MKESFLRLRALQEVDLELRTLTNNLDKLPARIKKLQSDAADAKTTLERTVADILEHKKQYKLSEVELKAADEKISAYSVQLYSAKTNEQYKAFLKEIEAQKKLKSGVEDKMIVLLEEAEALEQKRVTAEKDDGQLATESERKVKVLEAEQAELTAAIAEREKLRQEALEALPADLLKVYERIRKNKGGVAVVTTENERCNGCFNPVPAQRLLEIERQDRIYTCEACGRILVTEKS